MPSISRSSFSLPNNTAQHSRYINTGGAATEKWPFAIVMQRQRTISGSVALVRVAGQYLAGGKRLAGGQCLAGNSAKEGTGFTEHSRALWWKARRVQAPPAHIPAPRRRTFRGRRTHRCLPSDKRNLTCALSVCSRPAANDSCTMARSSPARQLGNFYPTSINVGVSCVEIMQITAIGGIGAQSAGEGCHNIPAYLVRTQERHGPF